MGSSESKQNEHQGIVQMVGATFVWKLENYSKIPSEKWIKCSSFAVSGLSYYLNLYRNSNLQVKLHREDSSTEISKFRCKICVVDGQGQDHHTKIKDVAMEKDSNEVILMNILESDLQRRKDNIIPADTLTISLNVTLLSGTGNSEPLNKDTAMFLETLSNDFGRFYQGNTDTDCVLKANATLFQAHRVVLSARSPVFAAMFQHDTKENRTGTINIVDIAATTLKDLLYYIYTGKIFELTADGAASMYVAADKYDLIELKEKSLNSFINNLAVDNVCKAAEMADWYNEPTLRNAVIRFFEENLDDVLNSKGWEKLFSESFKLANSYLKAAVRGKKKPESS